jgi:hypothetical protein
VISPLSFHLVKCDERPGILKRFRVEVLRVLSVKFSLLERNNVRDGNCSVIVEAVVVFRNLGCLGTNIQGRLEKLLKSERNIGGKLTDILEIRSMRKIMRGASDVKSTSATGIEIHLFKKVERVASERVSEN